MSAAIEVGIRVARWVAAENGTGRPQQVLQLFKVVEELREVLDELDRGHTGAAAAECADVVITARTAQAAIGILGRPVAGLATKSDGDVAHAERALVRAVADLGGVAIAWTQQNPRKRARGEQLADRDVVDYLDYVVQEACRLIDALGFDVAEVLTVGAAKIYARLDQVGVPQ